MSTVEPSGTLSIASTKPWTGRVTVSGSASGNISGSSTSRPMIRKSQRRSSFSSTSSPGIASLLSAQVRALDPEDDAQAGRHHTQRGADQDRALGGVLGDVHDPVLDRSE